MNNKNSKISQLRQRQRLLQILIFSLITITIWVTFSLFRSQKKTIISSEQKKLAEPLNPTIKVEVLQKLLGKKAYSEAELSGFPIYKILVSKDGKQSEVVTIDTKATELIPAKSPTPTPSPSSPTNAGSPSPSPITTKLPQSI